MALPQQITVRQEVVATNTPSVHRYVVIRLVNRLKPAIGTVLTADEVVAMIGTENLTIHVQ